MAVAQTPDAERAAAKECRKVVRADRLGWTTVSCR
jgi:hypothetical protein